VGLLNLAGSGGRYVLALARAGFRSNEGLRAHRRWVLVHLYAFAPRRMLDQYR
jgi:hypothetical protein